jgi:tRNA 2-thiouridine synthesizing protein A
MLSPVDERLEVAATIHYSRSSASCQIRPMIDVSPVTPLDLKGLKCPLPALRTRKVLRHLPPGALLVVECTDPLSVIDIPHLVNETGDVMEHSARADGLYVFHIRRTEHA